MKRMILGIVFLLCCSGNCKKPPFVEAVYRMKVFNNSALNIAALLSYQYPDTTVPENNDRLGGLLLGTYRYFDSKKPWEKVFEELPKDTLSIFFFNVDTFSTYDWQVIRKEYKVLERYDLSLQDLQNSNFSVTYP